MHSRFDIKRLYVGTGRVLRHLAVQGNPQHAQSSLYWQPKAQQTFLCTDPYLPRLVFTPLYSRVLATERCQCKVHYVVDFHNAPTLACAGLGACCSDEAPRRKDGRDGKNALPGPAIVMRRKEGLLQRRSDCGG